MTSYEEDAVRQAMRERYAAHYCEIGTASVTEETDETNAESVTDGEGTPESKSDADEGSMEASSE